MIQKYQVFYWLFQRKLSCVQYFFKYCFTTFLRRLCQSLGRKYIHELNTTESLITVLRIWVPQEAFADHGVEHQSVSLQAMNPKVQLLSVPKMEGAGHVLLLATGPRLCQSKHEKETCNTGSYWKLNELRWIELYILTHMK